MPSSLNNLLETLLETEAAGKEAQKQIFEAGTARKDWKTLAKLGQLKGIDPEVDNLVRDVVNGEVRVGWLTNPARSGEEVVKAMEDETRVGVLKTVAQSDDLPASAVQALIDKQNPAIAEALVGNPSVIGADNWEDLAPQLAITWMSSQSKRSTSCCYSDWNSHFASVEGCDALLLEKGNLTDENTLHVLMTRLANWEVPQRLEQRALDAVIAQATHTAHCSPIGNQRYRACSRLWMGVKGLTRIVNSRDIFSEGFEERCRPENLTREWLFVDVSSERSVTDLEKAFEFLNRRRGATGDEAVDPEIEFDQAVETGDRGGAVALLSRSSFPESSLVAALERVKAGPQELLDVVSERTLSDETLDELVATWPRALLKDTRSRNRLEVFVAYVRKTLEGGRGYDYSLRSWIVDLLDAEPELLDHVPANLFHGSSIGYGSDRELWKRLSATMEERLGENRSAWELVNGLFTEDCSMTVDELLTSATLAVG